MLACEDVQFMVLQKPNDERTSSDRDNEGRHLSVSSGEGLSTVM